jgi:hypothetical protein
MDEQWADHIIGRRFQVLSPCQNRVFLNRTKCRLAGDLIQQLARSLRAYLFETA